MVGIIRPYSKSNYVEDTTLSSVKTVRPIQQNGLLGRYHRRKNRQGVLANSSSAQKIRPELTARRHDVLKNKNPVARATPVEYLLLLFSHGRARPDGRNAQ